MPTWFKGSSGDRIFIPQNTVIKEYGYFKMSHIVKLLRKYKNNPEAIQFIADMLEE